MEVKNNWKLEELKVLYDLPVLELVYKAASVHRENHDANQVQISSLVSIKTGGCAEDCSYCPQAARYHTDIEGNDMRTVVLHGSPGIIRIGLPYGIVAYLHDTLILLQPLIGKFLRNLLRHFFTRTDR